MARFLVQMKSEQMSWPTCCLHVKQQQQETWSPHAQLPQMLLVCSPMEVGRLGASVTSPKETKNVS